MGKIELSCCFCSAGYSVEFTPPRGWADKLDFEIDVDERCFCPDHADAAEFLDAQCPGCVGGWGDCPLYRAFAFQRLTLTTDEFARIEDGFCPRRVNGTSMIQSGTIESLDLSDQASEESGRAMARAIKDYCNEYHDEALIPRRTDG